MFPSLLGKTKVFSVNHFFINNCLIWKRSYINLRNDVDESFKFENLIKTRQQEARRSILVHVPSKKACEKLHYYCQQFGSIANSYCYSVQSNHWKYMLIEFKNIVSINRIITSSVHLENDRMPVTSRFLEFDPKKQIKFGNKEKWIQINEKLPAPSKFDICNALKTCETVEDQMKLFYNLTCLSDLDIRLRYFGALQIESTLSGLFPNAKIYPFGSSVNGFGKIGSDLDLVLTLDSNDDRTKDTQPLHFHNRFSNDNRLDKKRHLSIVSDIMVNFLPGISDVRRILHARVPIIKYQQDCLDLEVDISNNDLSGLYMSKFLFLLSELDERIRPFVFCIRAWAKEAGLTNAASPGHWITNFSLTSLIIFYLQQVNKPILPRLDSFIHGDNKAISASIRNLSRIEFTTTNTMSLRELLTDFFIFYGRFNFAKKAISLHGATTIEKISTDAMHIKNPLDSTLNISRNVTVAECNRFCAQAKKAALNLELFHKRQTNGSWGIIQLLDSSTAQVDAKTKKSIFVESLKENGSVSVLDSSTAQVDAKTKKSIFVESLKENGSVSSKNHETNTQPAKKEIKSDSLIDFSKNIRYRYRYNNNRR